MLIAVLAVGLTALAVTTWLLAVASTARHGTDLANARLDAVRTGLGAGAAAGAAVGLMLAFRRQHHQEISTALTDHDATERRITELYTKAVEQLGSDKAPVRLGGLYALERLAQDNLQQRQTIVNVICAYLRMPFTSHMPGKASPDSEMLLPASAASTVPESTGDSWKQEKQVRLTAQRILSDHLRKHERSGENDRFWDEIRLDLTGATLFDFMCYHSTIAAGQFSQATFNGKAEFGEVTVTEHASFNGATFNGKAEFTSARFVHNVSFDGATFNGEAWFQNATLRYANFRESTFGGRTIFFRATFICEAWFAGAVFDGDSDFGASKFDENAWFKNVTFGGSAVFSMTVFMGNAQFHQATFNGNARFDQAIFEGPIQFDEATFLRPSAVEFSGAHVHSADGHVWPEGWQVNGNGTGELTIVRSNASSNP